MKTHTIKTPTAELLIVEMPEGWMCNAYKDQIGFCNEINKPMIQIKGSYTILGKPDEIMEEDAKELVHEDDGEFADYKHDANWFSTAKESLLSLLESEIYWNVNPIKHPKDYSLAHQSLNWYVEQEKKFIEAEQKTFNKNRSVIFKKKI